MTIREQKLGDYVKLHPELLNFLERMEVDLGFGDKTIAEVCKENHIPDSFFVELMLLVIKKYEFNPNYINSFDLKRTINYLYNSHNAFINEYVYELEILIHRLKEEEPEREKDCNLLINFFNEYKKEFLEHLSFENTDVYPYIIKLDECYCSGTLTKEVEQKIQEKFIKNYVNDHDSIEEKLNDFKSLIIRFFKPFKSKKTIKQFIKLTFELEVELELHELIENNVLFPLTIQLEEKILVPKT